MKGIRTIARRELHSWFVSPLAYGVATGFVLLAGFFFFNLLASYNYLLDQQTSAPTGRDTINLNQWVVQGYYHTLLVVLVFLIPLLTMPLFAEERRQGTFELLITSPFSVVDIVLGKYLALLVVVFTMLCLSFCFPLMLCVYGDPEVGPLVAGMIGVTLSAFGFVSIAMAASAFAHSQVVAGVSGMVVLLLLYVIHSPAEALQGVGGTILKTISPLTHARELLLGVVTSDSLVYFASLILIGVFISLRSVEVHRWR